MKSLVLAILLAAPVPVIAEPLMPTAVGTTWNYALVQEKMNGSLDLTQPNELERISVTYRMGGTEKIDGNELQRLEIYRDDALDSVDLITVNERGVLCPARIHADGKITKLVPPQAMVSTPLVKGKTWTFEGTIGEIKVNQRYEIADQEEIEVPAGNFRAWRIHCEQSSPAPATIDRWFVTGVGFVKVATVVKGESGIAAQRTWLNLKELPKTAPKRTAAPDSNKLTGDVSSEPKGAPKTAFDKNAPTVYARWHGRGLHNQAKVKAAFIAENVDGISPNSQIDEMETTAPAADSGGNFALSRPESGWTAGDYRVEFYLDDTLADTVKFKIAK